MNRLSQLHLPLDLSHTRIRDVALALLGGNARHPGLPYLAALMFMIHRRNMVTRPLLVYWQAARNWSTDPYWATGMFEQIRDLARSGSDRTATPLVQECNDAGAWLSNAQYLAKSTKDMLTTVDQVLETAFHLPDDHEQVMAVWMEIQAVLDGHTGEASGEAMHGAPVGFTPEEFMRIFGMGQGMPVPILIPAGNMLGRPRAPVPRGRALAVLPTPSPAGPRAKLYDPEEARNWLRRATPVRNGMVPVEESAKLRRLMEELANGDPTRPLAQIPGTRWGKPLASVPGGTDLAIAEPAQDPAAAAPAKTKRSKAAKRAASEAAEAVVPETSTPPAPTLDFLHADQARTRGPLAPLYGKFPHFGDVLDFLSRSLALAACGSDTATVKFPPILLRGEPGTGKTYFAQMLAEALGTPFHERDLSVSTEAFVLSGMDSGWKNSRPGLVFEAVARGAAANPLVLLNEVDKAAVSGTHNSPIAPMYSLLEPTSASKFVDEFVTIPIDASNVLWVLTANDGHIPAPILSRLEIFDIKPPTPEQCRLIAQSVWESVVKRELPQGHGFPETLADTLLDEMSRVSPRVMRKKLTAAASEAAFHGRRHLEKADLDHAAKRYEGDNGGSKIGFISS